MGVYNDGGLTRNSRFFMDTDDPRIATYLKGLEDGAVNADFFDFDGDGTNDSLVDGAKMGVKYITDKVGDFLGDLF